MAHGTLLPRMIIKMIAASERMLSSRSSRMAGDRSGWNGDSREKAIHPFYTFREQLAQAFLNKHPGVHSYEDMKQKLLFLPSGEPYSDPSSCQDNWIFALDLGMKPNRSWNLRLDGSGVSHSCRPVHAQTHWLCIYKLSFSGGSPPAECLQP